MLCLFMYTIQVVKDNKFAEKYAETKLWEHMKTCDVGMWNEHIISRDIEEAKPIPIINNFAPAPKKTQYKNVKDDRPKFSINM